jgi:hypothetical protein
MLTVEIAGNIPNEEVSPRIIRVTFNPVPSDDWSARVKQLNDHGQYHKA